MPRHNNNCFDTIRHFAALLVLFSHHYVLSGFSEPHIPKLESFGGVGVIIFFSISGYLIAQSAMRSKSFIDFMEKRCRRIFPALLPYSILLYFVLSAWLYKGSYLEYITSHGVKSFISTITLRGDETSNLAQGFIVKGSMNGSLWTLPLEFACYLISSIVIIFNKRKEVFFILFISFMFLSILYIIDNPHRAIFAVPLDHFSIRAMCFFLGASLSMSADAWNHTKVKLTIMIALLLYTLSTFGTIIDYRISAYLLITITTIFIGVSFKDRLVKGKFDFSYGIYIYAFPVQQMVINKMTLGFYEGMAVSMVITTGIAAISWNLVEKRFLRNKKI